MYASYTLSDKLAQLRRGKKPKIWHFNKHLAGCKHEFFPP